jgi:hydroxymethylpyrimidine pyrophosphatase-like HAD family hydrolase
MITSLNFKPRGILLDIDGTLVDSRRKISPLMIKTLKRISDLGICCGVATSRHYAIIKNYILPHFPKDSLHITSGGAQIVRSSGKIVWQKKIDKTLSKTIIKNVEELGGAVIFGSGFKLICVVSLFITMSETIPGK